MAQGFLGRAAALGASYMLGAFNDNFFKQSALLLAVAMQQSQYQAWGTLLFALPFVLFSAWGGWLADRFPKKNLVIAAKCLELTAMLAGAWGILHLNWAAIMLMLFCMGGSSTLFSPALNGSIPELFPRALVPRVNGFFKLCTTVSILLGVMLAGWALERQWLPTAIPFGRWLVAGGVVLAALLGLISTIFIPRWSVAHRAQPPFPWLGAWDSLKDFQRMRADRPLVFCLAADAFFYGISSLTLLEINSLGVAELGFSKTLTSLLPTALMVGICAGSLVSARGTPESWQRWLAPATAGIGLSLLAAGVLARLSLPSPMLFCCLLLVYAVAGLCGGFYIIPVSSFIQVRPEAGEKGRVLGTNNCLTFGAILLAGPLFYVLDFAPASLAHVMLGLATLAVALGFRLRIRRLPTGRATGQEPRHSRLLSLLLALMRFLLSLRYRVTVTGLEQIRADGRALLFLPNHAALSDPMLVYSRLARFQPRPLSDEEQVNRPFIRSLMRLVRPVTKPDLRSRDLQGGASRRAVLHAVETALQRCADALKNGDNLLFYPAGALTHDGREHLGGNSGVLRLLRATPECRVVLVRTRGLWGSSFSYATGRPDTLKGLAKGALRLLANGLFFMPRRPVQITFTEVARETLPQDNAKALNQALESWYEAEVESGVRIPYYFWQGSRAQPLPQMPAGAPAAAAEAPEAVRQQVYRLVAACVDGAPPLSPETRLAADLGIDSLSLTELAMQLEELAGHSVTRLDLLVTVADCVRAATGQLSGDEPAPEAPPAWFATARGTARRLDVPEAGNLPQAILRQARRNPAGLVLADADSAMSWRSFWLKATAMALLLRRECAREERVGLLLPASTAATLVWLAALLAGKTPVMLNWTTGPANLRHCVRLAGLQTILSAHRLLSRLADQGFDEMSDLGARLLCLEDAAKGLSLPLKVSAFVRSRLALLGIESLVLPSRMPESAAILFTSGSESAPKGVPLSHENILANCRDIAQVLVITSHDRMLAMLPPFHSLGLTVNMVLPLCFGLPVVLHPNPTEAARLDRICRRWRPSITVSPPSFLDAMLQKAEAGDLESLRLGVVGAEACPARLHAAFAEKTGGVLVEGYGVTECAPVISVNRPEDPQCGTIGLPLPSVSTAIVTTEGAMRRVKPGETGMLLVRGPNVFAGYLSAAGQPAPASPFVFFEGRSWYRSGDLVREDGRGCLSFAGRLGRFVKVGGEMISLPQMERVLLDFVAARQAGRLSEAANEGPGPSLAVEAVERDGQPEIVLCTALPVSVAEANQALRAAGLSALYSVRRVLQVAALPVLGSGKTDYRTVRRLIAGQA